jgi:hypothetical protein
MHTSLNDAVEQLKRIDHLIYVSLKYTRTVDILKSILKRLIECFDACILSLLELNVEVGRLPEVPSNVVARLATVNSLYPCPELERLLNLYLVMRKIDKAEAIRSNEYRRGVRMSVILKDVVVEIDIDNVEEYYKLAQTFFRICAKIIEFTESTGNPPPLDEVTRGVTIDLEFEKG